MKLSDVDLFSPAVYATGVPHEAFRVLRAESPVYFHKEPNGPGFWAITKHQDIVNISKDPKRFSSWRGGTILQDLSGEDLAANRAMMLNMDPPQHSKYRRLVSQGFTPRMTARLELHTREITTQIIDKIIKKGTCDFVTDVAAQLPLAVIAEMLGVPESDRQRLFDLSNTLIGTDDPDFQRSPDDGKRAAFEMWAYAHNLASQRKGVQAEDLTSILVNGVVDGEQLNEMEFNGFFLLLAVAGNETTRNLISGGMLALIQHPQERAKLMADRSLLPSAIEEMLRWVTPINYFRRTATCDVELRGQTIKENDKLALFYSSANRDEEIFEEPYAFQITRSPNEHLAFGVGEHFCLGASLARLEIRVMFEQILDRLPDLELCGPIPRLRSNLVNGIKSIPVRFSPAA
jgi:cholest-4-en-3-one 26-monooxygenase